MLRSCHGEPRFGDRAAATRRLARILSAFCVQWRAISALVPPAHYLHGVFDMPPGFGQFGLAFCLEFDGVLGCFRNGFGTMCFQQLPRIVVDFDFSHGVILLSFW